MHELTNQISDEFDIKNYTKESKRFRIHKNPVVKDLVVCKSCNNKEPQLIEKDNSFHLYECKECGFVFSKVNHPVVANPTTRIKECFSQKATSKEAKEYFTKAVAWLPNRTLRILNIGYDDPKIMNLLQKKGHKMISIRNVQELDENPQLQEKKFDVILTCDTTNITDPLPTFNRLFKMLSEFGMHLIYTDLYFSTKEIAEKIKKSNSAKQVPYAFYRYKTFEKIMDRLGHNIVYVNAKLIMARKAF
ncbi:MAG: hypothetical protein ACNS60_18575 [Candidatus Cyclobacteriaceae bacterium M2_1C_046]